MEDDANEPSAEARRDRVQFDYLKSAAFRVIHADGVVGGGVSLQRRFADLVRQWKEATRFASSITDMATHPAYQQLIGMGKEALPLILDELRREPDHWFWALKAITGEDPVPPADRG